MYNEQVKTRFLAENFKVYYNKKLIFKYAEEFERKFNKDIALFNMQELLFVFKKYNLQCREQIKNLKAFLLKYVEWYKTIYNEGSLDIKNVNVDFVYQISKTIYIKDTQALIQEMNRLLLYYNKPSMLTATTAIYLLWHGIQAEDIILIKKKDIDVNNCCIKIKDNTFNIEPEIMNFIDYYSKTQKCEFGSIYHSYFIDSPYLLRNAGKGTQTEYSMNPISFQQLRKLISSVDKDKICKYNISINYLLCNGEFYRIKQQSSDFSEAIKNSSILNNIFSDMKSTQERFDKYIMSYQ